MPESDYIRLEDVTKDYGEGRGNFHVDLSVKKGETLGIVGENGAGKTTLMRQLMGFISSDEGFITIDGMDAYLEAQKTKRLIGYIPGEINFPDVKSGTAFLHSYGDALGAKEEDYAYANELIRRMQLDIRAYPKRMSKGMKQKTSIVAAFMRRPSILFLDEPSIGLDPLMREELLRIILEQKERGATIVMSSNSVEELERVSDKVALINKGRVVDLADMRDIADRPFRDYKVEFRDEGDFLSFRELGFPITRIQEQYHQATVRLKKEDLPRFLSAIQSREVKFLSEVPYTLSTYFKERRALRNEPESR